MTTGTKKKRRFEGDGFKFSDNLSKKFSDTVFFSYLLIFDGLLVFPIYKHSISPQIFERRGSLKVVPNVEKNV